MKEFLRVLVTVVRVLLVLIEQNTPEPEVKVYIPMYKPLQVSKCKKCGKTIAEPKMLIRIIQGKVEYWREKL